MPKSTTSLSSTFTSSSIQLMNELVEQVANTNTKQSPSNTTNTFLYKIHPMVVLSILDHYQRVAQSTINTTTTNGNVNNTLNGNIIGCLFGEFREGGYFEIKNSIPLKLLNLENVQYFTKIENLHRKVYPNDILIGYYSINGNNSKNSIDKQVYQLLNDQMMKNPLILNCNLNIENINLQNSLQNKKLIDFKGYMNKELFFKDKLIGTLFEQVKVEYLMNENEKLTLNYLQNNNYLQNHVVFETTCQQLKKDLEDVLNYLKNSKNNDKNIYYLLFNCFNDLVKLDDFDKNLNYYMKDLQMIIYLTNLLQNNLNMNEQLTTTAHEL
ncbi:hypothetical protein ABK040_011304 [Willaertia magna]